MNCTWEFSWKIKAVIPEMPLLNGEEWTRQWLRYLFTKTFWWMWFGLGRFTGIWILWQCWISVDQMCFRVCYYVRIKTTIWSMRNSSTQIFPFVIRWLKYPGDRRRKVTVYKHRPQHLILCNCKSSLKQERGGLIMEQLLPQIMSDTISMKQ